MNGQAIAISGDSLSDDPFGAPLAEAERNLVHLSTEADKVETLVTAARDALVAAMRISDPSLHQVFRLLNIAADSATAHAKAATSAVASGLYEAV